MSKVRMGFMRVIEDGIKLTLHEDGVAVESTIQVVTTLKEFDAWQKHHNPEVTMGSSTMDFPEDETDNKDVIQLAHDIAKRRCR